nr:hypothetical protein [Nitrospirales bacterium]
MINAVPFFFGPLESPPQVTGQPGGVRLDQAKTTESPSNNSFEKIFRDQSTAASLLNSVSNTTPGKDEGEVSNLELPLGTPSVSGDNLLTLYLAGVLAKDEQRVTEESDGQSVTGKSDGQPVLEEGDGNRVTEEAGVETSSIPLAAEGLNGSNTGGQAGSQKALLGLLPGNVSQDGPVFGVVMSPHAFLQGAPGGQTGPTAPSSVQAGLPLFMGTSPNQTASVGNMVADPSATDLVIKVDSQQVFRNAVVPVAGEAVTESGTNQGKPADRFSSPVQDPGLRPPQNPLSPIALPQESLKPVSNPVNQMFQVPEPFEETPADIADIGQLSQNRLKYVSGILSALSESPPNGKDSSIGIPVDLLADANASLTGDRSRGVLEATGKAEGMDPNAGQGLNNGMGNPTHSQSGFQQSSSSPSPGTTVR